MTTENCDGAGPEPELAHERAVSLARRAVLRARGHTGYAAERSLRHEARAPDADRARRLAEAFISPNTRRAFAAGRGAPPPSTPSSTAGCSRTPPSAARPRTVRGGAPSRRVLATQPHGRGRRVEFNDVALERDSTGTPAGGRRLPGLANEITVERYESGPTE